MKKTILIFMSFIVLIASVPSNAANISIGATTWYSWWEIKDSSEDIDPGILYGPALAINFNENFSLNFVFLYGEYDVNQEFLSYTYKRYDSDTSLSYKLNDYFKLFAGFKYNAYSTEVPEMNLEFGVKMYGPAAGLSAVLPLGYDFFILANGSGMYIFGESNNTGLSDERLKGYGYNTAASLAYYIAPASVTLSLGGRYQSFKVKLDESDSELKMDFYGFTAAAIYSFSI